MVREIFSEFLWNLCLIRNDNAVVFVPLLLLCCQGVVPGGCLVDLTYAQFERVVGERERGLEHKLGVIRTLHKRAENVPVRTEGKSKQHKHMRTALKSCGYSHWAYVKSTKHSRNNTG